MYFCSINNGFYADEQHLKASCIIISDAVFITKNEHSELIEKQTKGFLIKADVDGKPIAVPRTPASTEDLRKEMIISNAQARLKLIKLGLFDAIDKAILSMPRNAPLYVLWEYGADFHRTNEHLTAFCTDTLKMTAEDIDALFM